ncbi:recombinase family protein [Desulfatitalea tepidiphila]|uniref:recombinase family protein n=1 Tax=Desulfatitalea tepidiphila TaxID=1185843 RepID=UPI0006B3FA7E|nr:recombinase family protein [Desulfatitalea tepidiphila]
MSLKDLADKTRRGLRGRVEKGKSGGGLAYCCKVARKFNAQGEAIRGEREIDEAQARIVRRIFREYAVENKSPKAIAASLNKEGIACPSGKTWAQSTINGNRRRGTEILNNDLHIGELVWNRQRFIKKICGMPPRDGGKGACQGFNRKNRTNSKRRRSQGTLKRSLRRFSRTFEHCYGG